VLVHEDDCVTLAFVAAEVHETRLEKERKGAIFSFVESHEELPADVLVTETS